MGCEGAERGIDQVDAGERCGGDAGLGEQGRALRPLLASLRLPVPQMPGDGMGEGFEAAALARTGQAGEQRLESFRAA